MDETKKIRNVGFAKIGKSLKFASAYSAIGGDNEGPQLLRILANSNPDLTFTIVGRSDFHKLSTNERLELFPYDNVVDAWENARGPAKQDHLVEYFKNNPEPDAFIAMPGQIGTVTIQGKIQQVKDRSLIASVIDMTKNYTSPITFWWNANPQIPVIEIINDPRYDLAQSRDIINDPKVSLSQYTYKYKKSTITSYADQDRVERDIDVVYAGMEKIFLYGRPQVAVNNVRDTNFMVVLNEGNPSRYKMLKEWVLDSVDDVEIYGKWDHPDAVSDSRFKGTMQLDDLQVKLTNVRSTFIIPIAKGWVTSKYIEMIHVGVVPFFHPTYDEQDHLKVPEFLRPKNSKELMERVEQLKDDTIYKKVIRALQNSYCRPADYDGSTINDRIMVEIDPNYVRPDLSQFSKKKGVSLDDFFV